MEEFKQIHEQAQKVTTTLKEENKKLKENVSKGTQTLKELENHSNQLKANVKQGEEATNRINKLNQELKDYLSKVYQNEKSKPVLESIRNMEIDMLEKIDTSVKQMIDLKKESINTKVILYEKTKNASEMNDDNEKFKKCFFFHYKKNIIN